MTDNATTTLADALANHVAKIGSAELSDAVVAKVRQHLLDGIASAFIGCRSTVFADLTGAGSSSCGSGFSRACDGAIAAEAAPTAVGESSGDKSLGDKAADCMAWAFAVNGSVSEDGSREGACHPAAAIVPVIMTYGGGKSLDLIDRAMVAGYDVMIRLARAGNPLFARKGFHGTAVTAPFGAAATFAVLQGFELPAIKNALCLAALGGSGLMAAFKEGSTQPLQVGWGVRNGVQAALLAEKGHLGYPRVLEDGFFPAYLEKGLHAGVLDPLEFEYAIEACYLKPYPGCRHMHASLNAFGNLVEEHGIAHAEIASVRVGTYRIALETGIKTVHKRGDAYFNIPYAVAARAVLGRADYDAFSEEHFGNPDIGRVMGLTSESVDPEIEAEYPGRRGARVEVELSDGRVFSHRVQYPLGEPEAPLDFAVTREKFLANSAGYLTGCEQAQVVAMLETGAKPDGTLCCELLTERLLGRRPAEGAPFF